MAGFYEELEQRGYRYDGAFRAVRKIERGPGAVAAEIAGSDVFAASLDACLHAALALTTEGLLVPVSAECVEIERKPEGDLRSLVQRRGEQFDIEVRDSQGVCARIEGCGWKPPARIVPAWQDWCYRTRWIPAAPPAVKSTGRQRFRIFGPAGGLRRFLEDRGQAVSDDGPADHVLYFADGEDFEEVCGGALELAQALESERPSPRLWLITRGGSAAQAGLWGLGRVIARELPFLACTCVELDSDAADWRDLWRELGTEPANRK